MTELLTIDRIDETIAVLTLNRPDRRNALSIALRDDISDALERLRADDDLQVLVITGAGQTFSAGFDLNEFNQALEDQAFGDQLWASSDRYHHAVATFPLPVIAAVNGPAIAGGFDLAVLCDLRVVSTTTYFEHPERTFGDVVYGPLRELVGGANARDLILTGRQVGAEDAVRLGLASTIVTPERIIPAALELARVVAKTPRNQLLRHKAKILRFTGTADAQPTLEL